jgi:aminoglycoside 3-N-acetyltransferase
VVSTVFNFVRRAWNQNITASDLERALNQLGVGMQRDVMAHSSLSAFGFVQGGAPTLIDVLQRNAKTVVMPAFTYYTLVWPEHKKSSDWPAFPPADGPTWRPDSPVSHDIGRIPQQFLEVYQAVRSHHPALSFAALGASTNPILSSQTLEHPYAPIGVLYALDADIVLLGVDHRSNTSVHYGEYLAGRPMLERYAYFRGALVRTFFPNCSAAFNAIQGHLDSLEVVGVGKTLVQRMSVRDVVDTTVKMLARDPEALLCNYNGCRCSHVREKIRKNGLRPNHDSMLESGRALSTQL